MAYASRILPINRAKGGGGWDESSGQLPKAAIQSITMSVRFGEQKYAIGYIQQFKWSISRDNAVLHQIEAYPNGTFGEGGTWGSVGFSGTNQASYWPGEAVEVVPGKQPGIDITLNRYALYTSNALSAIVRSDNAGTEEDTPIATNADINITGATGYLQYVSLLQQVRPVDIHQIYYSPVDGKPIFGRRFEECWFKTYGEEIPDADKNGPILENAVLTATRIRPLHYT